jgi:hypothetical protein
MWAALSDERMGRLQLLLALANAVILRSESRGACDHILLFQIRDTPSLRERAAQLYPQALGSFFVVASYNFQGYGGGI